MNIFHICSDFGKQKLYKQLVDAISLHGANQRVFVPIRSVSELASCPDSNAVVQYKFVRLLYPWHRILFGLKIQNIYNRLLVDFDPEVIDLVHAHFLYSDGAVALAIKKTFGTRYIVAVRNTDLNYFMRLRLDLNSRMYEIVDHAHAVVFLSPAYRLAFLSQIPRHLAAKIEPKCSVIPNGLGNEWFKGGGGETATGKVPAPAKILYVGDFSRNKNLANLCKAMTLVRRKSEATLTIVGGSGILSREVRRVNTAADLQQISIRSFVNSIDELIGIYRAHDVFVMPSYRETFGVAYIEALSQGLPIIHSRGQGVDGFFKAGTVSEPVDPNLPEEISDKIQILIRRLPFIRNTCKAVAEDFCWTKVAEKYISIYSRALGS